MSLKKSTSKLRFIKPTEVEPVPEGPGRVAIDQYATLITLNPRACSLLFAEDATYICSQRGERTILNGRKAIAEQLLRVPVGVTFSVSFYRQDKGSAMAELAIEGLEFGLVVETVLFTLEDGAFTRFEILQWD